MTPKIERSHAMQIGSARRDIDRFYQEALSRRAQTRTQFFKSLGNVARPLIGTVAILAAYISALRLISLPAAAEVPSAIAAPGEILVTMVHAVGAQVYECRPDSAGKLVWQFREPIATLIIDGKTVGRHYAGPTWEMMDGSAVSGKVAARAPGAGPNDIPLLKLEAIAWHGAGKLSGVTTIQRLNTRGGNVDAACDSSGTFLSAPYTADYTFYRKGE
jgi:Protein of unknown function (DUF3455)